MSKNSKKIIVVLSAGRSGTSLLMKILGLLGMELSVDMVEGRFENPEGYYEDSEIVSIHKKLLEKVGGKATLPLPEQWLDTRPAKVAVQDLKTIVQLRLKSTEKIWGFKDPRTASFFPIWVKVFNSLGVVPVFILALRNPANVAISQRRQINREEAISELQWLLRVCDSLEYTASDCYILHYEDWFEEPQKTAQKLLKYCGLDKTFKGCLPEILRMAISPNLNRSVYDNYQIQNESVRDLYRMLKECRGHEFDRAKLMETVKHCRKNMDAFKGWSMEAGHAFKKVRQLGEIEKVHVAELKQKEDLIRTMEFRNHKSQKRLKFERRRHQKNLKSLKRIKQSLSFRLGQAIVESISQPGKKTIMLPFKIIHIAYCHVFNLTEKKTG